MKKKLQIIIPIIVIILIVGIIVIKNNDNKKLKEENNNFTQNGDNIPFIIEDASLEKLKQYNMPVIVDFGADWCAPCKAMEPTLKKLNKDMQGKAAIQFLDINKYPNGAKGYPVELIPTQLFINADGSPYVPSDKLSKEIEFKKYFKKDDGSHYYTVHTGYLSEEQMLQILEDMGVKIDG